MQSLVMMLKNIKTETYHPIFYLQTFFPGGDSSEMNEKYIRYKSKGHHTSGFKDRQSAIDSINNELIDQIKSIGYTPVLELESDMEWDGEGVPADNQIRPSNDLITT